MWTKVIGILGGLLLLAACSSAPETPPGGPGDAGGPGVGGPGGIGSRNALPGSQQDLEASAGVCRPSHPKPRARRPIPATQRSNGDQAGSEASCEVITSR